MEHQTKRIAIGNWTGLAYFVDGEWYVRPQSIIESLGFDWVKIRKKVVSRYANDIKLVQKSAGMGAQKPVLMRLDAAVQWLAGYAGNNKMAAEKRVVATEMATAIARQFAAMALESGCAAPSEEVVVLADRKAVQHG
jgi:hypothetical protein